MSVERRLREGLERSAAAVQPDVGRRLPEAITRGRRRRRARRASLIVGTVAALAVVGVALPQVTGFVQRSPAPRSKPGADAGARARCGARRELHLDAGRHLAGHPGQRDAPAHGRSG